MRSNVSLLAAITLLAAPHGIAGCSKSSGKKADNTPANEAGASRGGESPADAGSKAPGETADSGAPAGAVIELERLYTQNQADRAPVRVAFTAPEGWVKGKPSGRAQRFFPEGKTFLPSISIEIALDHLKPDEITAKLDKRLEADRTKAVGGGEVTVVRDEELDGRHLLVRRVDARDTPRKIFVLEARCYVANPDGYVVMLHGIADAKKEAEIRPVLEGACSRLEVLGLAKK